jgi:hypothetical protein
MSRGIFKVFKNEKLPGVGSGEFDGEVFLDEK